MNTCPENSKTKHYARAVEREDGCGMVSADMVFFEPHLSRAAAASAAAFRSTVSDCATLRVGSYTRQVRSCASAMQCSLQVTRSATFAALEATHV